MTHTWADVAYGFFVGSSGDISPAALIAGFAMITFIAWGRMK